MPGSSEVKYLRESTTNLFGINQVLITMQFSID